MMSHNGRIPFGSVGIDRVKQQLEEYWQAIEQPRILEAGCGSGSNIRIPSEAHVTGIDISEEELAKNSVIHEKIVGDLETYPLERETFDLVVCWDVLEHLRRPQMAVENMANCLRTDGLLLLAVPNVRSVKAVVAKFTPLWFHSMVNRMVYGERAGEPGYINFPTVLDPSIAPDAMTQSAEKMGLELAFGMLGQSGMQKKLMKKLFVGEFGTEVIDLSVRLVSLGRFSMKQSDCILLFRKTERKVPARA
jgi:SAM-dependent methyltransferase